MCLRNTPSNCAPSLASAARERSLRASVLSSTRVQCRRSKACSNSSSLHSTLTPVPQTAGEYHEAETTTALDSVYSSIRAEIRRTWLIEYFTGEEPGDNLHLRVPQLSDLDRHATCTLTPGAAS